MPEEAVMTFMDTLAILTGAPNRDLAHELIGQSTSPESHKNIADTPTPAVITRVAPPLIDKRNTQIYQYDNLPGLFERARFHQFWPLLPEGDFVTHEQVQGEYQSVSSRAASCNATRWHAPSSCAPRPCFATSRPPHST